MIRKVIDAVGTIRYYNEKDQLHRIDGPAVEYANGTKCWFLNGQRHRIDGPAVEYANGDEHWYLNGQFHREDGPVLEFANGDKFWYLNGKEYPRPYTDEEWQIFVIKLLLLK